jgi:uncharacterized phage-associated protein
MFEIVRSMSWSAMDRAARYPGDMPVHAADVAAEIRRHLPNTPTKKLHKLLYYCQGHHLAATGEPLFTETISAWDMGPVVGNLWYAEKEHGPGRSTTELTEGQLNTVGYVLSRYGNLSGRDLERLAHAETPWRRANQSRLPGQSSRIEEDWLLHQFRDETDEDVEPSFDSAVITQWLTETANRPTEPIQADTYDAIRARMSSGN